MLTIHISWVINPAVNVDLRSAELHYVNEWALVNNLKLNLAKKQEIIFTYHRRKTKYPDLDEIPFVQQVRTIKLLSVTFTSSLSVTLHVHSVIASCAQTLYALRVLCKHGLCDSSLHYFSCSRGRQTSLCIKCVVGLYKCLSDRQKIIAFIHRSNRTVFYAPDLADFILRILLSQLMSTCLRKS